MKKQAKSKRPKIGNSKPKTKKTKLNESTDHTDAAADEKEKAIDAEESNTTSESDASPESTGPLDENDEAESTNGTPTSEAEGNPAPYGVEPSEQATALEVIDPGGSKPKEKGKKPGGKAVPAQQDVLSDQERTTLEDCLEVIHQGMDTFVQVGSAIATIVVQKLYRETHPTFERYAKEVLLMSPRRAYQLKDASEVIENLKTANNCSQNTGGSAELLLPTNENQVRALKKFSPDVQREIWAEAVKAAGEKMVTGKVLAEVIEAREKTVDQSTANDPEKQSGKDDVSTFDEEIEIVMATLNRAWKVLSEAHHSALLDRVSAWLKSTGDAESTS